MKPSFDDADLLLSMPKIIVCNRTPIVKVIVENVVTCFLGHSVVSTVCQYSLAPNAATDWCTEVVGVQFNAPHDTV